MDQIVLVIGVLVFICIAVYIHIRRVAPKAEYIATIMNDHKGAEEWSFDDGSFVALEFLTRTIIISSGNIARKYGFSKILTAEVLENDSPQGPVKRKANLNRISLRVMIDDKDNPVYTVTFFRRGLMWQNDGDVDRCRDDIQKCYARVNSAIRQGSLNPE
jgi:hypothetical protein